MNKMREILLHICVICSLVCMVAKILDWYNPYMDFTGHIWWIQMALYLSAVVLGITRKYTASKQAIKQRTHIAHTGRNHADHTMRKLIR